MQYLLILFDYRNTDNRLYISQYGSDEESSKKTRKNQK